MKSTLTDMKTALEGITGTLEEAGDWTSDPEDKLAENIKLEQQLEGEEREEALSAEKLFPWDIQDALGWRTQQGR